jgi:hypothetical protein
MTPQSHEPKLPDPRRTASRPRRVLHFAVALAGWALFVYWWMLVLRRTGEAEMRFTGWFLALSLAVIVLVTIAWVAHNTRLHRALPARSRIRQLRVSFHEDSLGRPVQSLDDRSLTDASVVRIVVDDGRKRYFVTPAGFEERISSVAGGSTGTSS